MFGLTQLFFAFNSLFIGYYFFSKNIPKINLCRKILKYCGYKFEILDLNNMPSKLIIIGSHTSIYDFFIGAIYYYAILHEKYDSYILMKNNFEIFVTPLLKMIDSKFKLISVGKNKNGLTKTICNHLKDKENYLLFIAPEGTRKITDKIKSGYWVISKELNINISYIGIDFDSKNIYLEKWRSPCNDWESEQYEFINSCKKYVPLYPERCFWTKEFYYD